MSNSGAIAEKPRLTPWQQHTLQSVIDAARETPGSLRLLARGDHIFTAQCRYSRLSGEHTRWRIEDTFRNLIASGDC